MKKRILSIVLAVLMLVGILPISAMAATEPEQPLSNITATKKAEWVNETEGIARVTIEVSGKKPEEMVVTDPTDIVLVIDRSLSMDDKATSNDRDDKMTQAKNAAKQFAQKMLESDKVRIAVVMYTKTAQTVKGQNQDAFSNKYATVESRINSITTSDVPSNNSGTNIQAGIHEARELLNNSKATNKIMIVLSDGQPNYSFRFVANADYVGCERRTNRRCNNFGMTGGSVQKRGDFTVDYEDFVIEKDWYNNATFDLQNGNAIVKITCKKHGTTKYDYGVYNGSTYNGNTLNTDHSVATIWEAGQAKNKGVEIYSIGFGIGKNQNAIKTMKGIASAKTEDHYFSAGMSANDIEEVFNSIAKQVSKYVAYKPTVIDTISNDFVYYTDSKLTASAGERDKVEVSQDGKTVTWDLAAEQLDTTEHTLTFYVQYKHLDENVPAPDAVLPTNNGALLKYAKEENGQATETQNIANASVPSLSKTVSYEVTGTPPKGYMKPGDAHVWVGQKHKVAAAPESMDADGGTYTFEGWKANGAPVSGELPITADITLTGEWKFEAAPTTKTITVTKVWDKDVTDAQKQPVVITLYQTVGMGTVNPETDYYASITLNGTETAPWTGVFKDLPLKNDKDEKYGYAVVETKIGTLQVTNGSANVIRMNEDGESAYTVGTWFVNSSRTPAEPNTYYITNTYTSKPQYTLDYQFVGNAPTGVEEPVGRSDCYEGEKITLTAMQEVTGWTFDGWYSDDTCNTKVNDPYRMPANNVTLYGKWTKVEPETVTVSYRYVAESGTLPAGLEDKFPLPEQTTVNKGSNITISNAAKTGSEYPVDGGKWVLWSWIADNSITGVQQDVTFTGTWKFVADEPKTTKITVKKEWGTGVTDEQKLPVVVRLLDHGVAKWIEKDITLDGDNNWIGTFTVDYDAEAEYSVIEAKIGTEWFYNGTATIDDTTWEYAVEGDKEPASPSQTPSRRTSSPRQLM